MSFLFNEKKKKPFALGSPSGPHGFTLLHHAKVGGEESKELFAYLQEKGLKEDWLKLRWKKNSSSDIS